MATFYLAHFTRHDRKHSSLDPTRQPTTTHLNVAGQVCKERVPARAHNILGFQPSAVSTMLKASAMHASPRYGLGRAAAHKLSKLRGCQMQCGIFGLRLSSGPSVLSSANVAAASSHIPLWTAQAGSLLGKNAKSCLFLWLQSIKEKAMMSKSDSSAITFIQHQKQNKILVSQHLSFPHIYPNIPKSSSCPNLPSKTILLSNRRCWPE